MLTSLKKRNSVFLKLSSSADEKLMAGLLGDKYEIQSGEDYIHRENTDLLVIDYAYLERNFRKVVMAIESAGNIYLPVMVMIPKGKSGTQRMWDLADDVVEMPVSKMNFLTRIKGLMKIRKYSRRAELQKKKLEQKNHQLGLYYKAIDASTTGITIADPTLPDTPITFCNKAFCEMTGYSQEEIIGGNCRFLQGDDRDQAARYQVQRALSEGESCEVLLRNYRKDGTLFWAELKISPIKNKYDEVEYFVGIQNDVTNLINTQKDLKSSMEKWETIVSQSPNMVQISVDGVIKFMNRAGAQFHGVENPEEMIDSRIIDLIPEEEHLKFTKRLEQVEKGIATEPAISSVTDTYGKKRFLRIQSIPVMYEGKPAAQTVGEDVTQLKESEMELKHTINQKQILLQEVHHRVKNNLAVLSALIQLQMAGLKSDEAISVLNDTEMRIISIAKVHEMLYNQESLNEIGFGGYVAELASKIEATLGAVEKPPKIELDIDPVNLSLDQSITCGLLLNELITNSIKHAYNPNEQIKIDIKVEHRKDEVTILYRDYGKGLSDNEDFFKEGNFGSMVINILLTQLKADWNMESDHGLHFSITFRKADYHGPSRYFE